MKDVEKGKNRNGTAERTCSAGEKARCFAETSVCLGYRKERYGSWIPDREFISRSKLRYRCSNCGYWKAVKAKNSESMLRSLRYCNSCGAKMSKTDSETEEAVR